MVERLGPHAANALTALRVLLTPCFVWLILHAQQRGCGVVAALVFAIVAVTDVWDGRAARRWDSATTSGRVFDHFADIGFILAALSTYVALGIAPWWVPAAIAAAFAFYVLNSLSRPRDGALNLISNRIGHTGGVCNYVLIGVLVCNNSAGIGLLSADMLAWFFALVPAYSGLALLAGLTARWDLFTQGGVLVDPE